MTDQYTKGAAPLIIACSSSVTSRSVRSKRWGAPGGKQPKWKSKVTAHQLCVSTGSWLWVACLEILTPLGKAADRLCLIRNKLLCAMRWLTAPHGHTLADRRPIFRVSFVNLSRIECDGYLRLLTVRYALLQIHFCLE